MLARSILLGGAAAMGASAMLVVPEMEAVEDGFLNISPKLIEDTRQLSVELPCTECPFRQVDEEGAVSWVDGKSSSLMLDFSIEDNLLLANGLQIFPPAPPSPIDVTQTTEDGEVAGPVLAGYAIEIIFVNAPSDEPAAHLIDVRFTITDLETHSVPVDTIAITLVQDNTGELFIATTEVERNTERKPWNTCHGDGKFKCLQKLIMDRIHGLSSHAKDRFIGKGPGPMDGLKDGPKGCDGKKGWKGLLDMFGGHHGPHHGPHHHHDDEETGPEGMSFHEFEEGPEGHPHHPHHDEDFDFEGPGGHHHGEKGPDDMPFPDFEGPKGHHGHGHFDPESADRPHHMHHGPPPGAFTHTFSRVVRFILVPAILGVLAGLTASAVGMLVGQAVVFVWQRYRGTKSQEHKAAWEQGDACEKQGLMAESEDVLPEYIETSQTHGSMDKK
jgi:hypothetical protein